MLTNDILPAKRRASQMQATGPSTPTIDESDWESISNYLQTYDAQRENLIKRCRDVQKFSKQAIFSLHRGDAVKAGQQLSSAESIAKELLPIVQQNYILRHGAFSNAIEEYVEAAIFRTYLQDGRLATSTELPLAEPEEYLGGVLDFTGELNRYAIQQATCRNKEAVQRCRDLVEAVMGQFLQFDLRNSALRKKYDGLKYTLKKMENTLYELSLTESAAGLLKVGATDDMETEGADEPGSDKPGS